MVTHAQSGLCAALQSAFVYAQQHQYDYLITIDCDGQHQPRLDSSVRRVLQGLPEHELPFNLSVVPMSARSISSQQSLFMRSRWSRSASSRSSWINVQITDELNCCLGLNLTDAFCGFKAYRVAALSKLITKRPAMRCHSNCGFVLLMPNSCRRAASTIVYLEEKRSFGGALDDPDKRSSILSHGN